MPRAKKNLDTVRDHATRILKTHICKLQNETIQALQLENLRLKNLLFYRGPKTKGAS